MALIKSIYFRGATGNYLKIYSLRFNPVLREARACIALYANAAHAAANATNPADEPIGDRLIKVDLLGTDFDAWLSAGALQVAAESHPATYDVVRAQVYRAAKAGVGVISDWGPNVLADAIDD